MALRRLLQSPWRNNNHGLVFRSAFTTNVTPTDTNYQNAEKEIAASQRKTRDWVKLGNFEKAQACGEEALKKIVSHFGLSHPVHASALNDLGLIHKCLGEYDTAISTYEKALEIYEESLGTQEHASYSTTLTNLGHVYRAQASSSETPAGGMKKLELVDHAWVAFERAAEIRSKVLDRSHPDNAMSLVNLGTTAFHQGKPDVAVRYLREAVKTLIELVGSEHLMTSTARNNLAFVLKCDGKFEEAIDLYKQVLNTRKSKLGDGHYETITVMHNLAEAYRATPDGESEALKLQSEILAIMNVEPEDVEETKSL